MVYIHNGVLVSNKEEYYYVICGKMEWTGDHHVMQNKADPEIQISSFISHTESRSKTTNKQTYKKT
jgi:hypothetical protein